jgi:two-component system CheB/CheR fusion protein
VRSLLDDVLIGVTSFFRDPSVFEVLESRVFPKLFAGTTSERPLRCWVVGCSTGQEAYSLAMAAFEAADARGVAPRLRIFATDLDEAALATARRGIYPSSIESEVSADRLTRFFTRVENGYRIHPDIREVVTFARHDVARDPPFVGLDLLSCRNVLIYMAASLRRSTIATLHFALEPGGTLLLGSSEGVSGFEDAFDAVDAAARVYTRLDAPARPLRVAASPLPKASPTKPAPKAPRERDWSDEISRVLLAHYAPPAVLLTGSLEVAFIHGRTERYLRPPEGRPTFKLVSIARENLFLEIRSAVEEARTTDRPVVRTATVGGQAVALGITPLRMPGVAEPSFLVTFEAGGPTGAATTAAASPADAAAAPGMPATGLLGRVLGLRPSGDGDAENVRLRSENAIERRRTASLLDEYREALEALEVSNEGVLSANEGLESALEEMQTLKEEVEASNEELSTLNTEFRAANAELTGLNADLTNLFASVEIAIVMVSAQRRIRRFTKAAAGVLGLGPEDVGRSIESAGFAGQLPGLLPMVQSAIDSGEVSHREVTVATGRWCALTVRPYASGDGRIDGAVVALHDIHELKTAAAELTAAREYAEAVLRTMGEPFAVITPDMRIRRVNRAFREVFGGDDGSSEDRTLPDALGDTAGTAALEERLRDTFDRRGALRSHEMGFEAPGAARKVFAVNADVLRSDASPLLLVVFEDVTERHDSQQALQQLNETLEARTRALDRVNVDLDRFAHVAAHDLIAPLRHVLQQAAVLREDVTSHPPAQLLEAIGGIEASALHGANLVNGLLELYALGRVELKRERIRLPGFLTALVAAIGLPAGRDVRVDPALPVLEADPECLRQVFQNLIANGLKFNESPAPLVTVSWEPDREGGAAILVRDNGIGIPPKRQEEVLLGLVRLEGSRYEGVGLGLGIVMRAAERMDWRVSLDPAPAEGTTFILQPPGSSLTDR